ncbi:hypothetical protein [Chroococcidiopsis cubana]|uniref:hypothetical protein n=1 Tax=Chroococcidiopsis cubana TaxID=171392 RepID=UPI002ACD5497|nr:hypothetical protein [Chroococcidiopsis cubana]
MLLSHFLRERTSREQGQGDEGTRGQGDKGTRETRGTRENSRIHAFTHSHPFFTHHATTNYQLPITHYHQNQIPIESATFCRRVAVALNS